MIITKIVDITINSSNINHYKKLGYNIKNKDKIKIPIKHLSKGSNVFIKAKCDICEYEKDIKYYRYLENISKHKIFSCCRKCANIKREKTNIEKYDVTNVSKLEKVKEKRKKTIFDRYGVEHALQNKKIYDKMINTNIERYNIEYPQKLDIFKEKAFNTNIKKYGVKVAIMRNDIKEKQKQTLKKFYEITIMNKYENIISYKNNIFEFKCDKGHTYKIERTLLSNRKMINTILCTVCNPVGSSKSGLEIQLYDFINYNYNGIIMRNERKLLNNKYELDIYIPDLNLAFEFNGLYWHNELHKENNYHLKKTELCEEQGIQLIHIYEDDWIYKQNIVKSMILNKLGKSTNKIFGRKTEVREITDNKLVREFLNKNHLQGFIGAKVKLGLFFDNELISLMTFGKRRVAMGKNKSKEGEYELLRFCSKLNTNVVGGANKLFKYFIKNNELKEITTYADRSWSQGGLYRNLGFEYQGKTKPNYYYIIDSIKHYRFNFRKNKLVEEGYSVNKTEHQIMLDRKIYRIYDSGNLLFKTKKRI